MKMLGLFFALLTALPGNAEQFVLFDVTFNYSKSDADGSKPSQSHYYVKGPLINPDRPKDWTSPVDYYSGPRISDHSIR